MNDLDIMEKLERYKLDEKGKKEFKDRLITLRNQKGWSQESLAEKLDVTRQTISKWESRQTMPAMDKLIKLSKLYNLTMDELVYGEDKNEQIKDEEEIKKENVKEQVEENNSKELNYTVNIQNNMDIKNNKNQVFDIIKLENKTKNKALIRKNMTKMIISIILIVLLGYLISKVYNFFILKEINNKFNEYNNINNCYYETKEVVSNDICTLYVINTKYWYKDGVLKREEVRTENGVNKSKIIYIDSNKKERYVLSEHNKTGTKVKYNEFDEAENGIIKHLIGVNYYSSNFEIIRDALVSRISINKDNYIVERRMVDYRKNVYNKENAIIEQNITIDSNNEETKVIHNLQINVVTDEDLLLNLEGYNIEETK